MKRTLSKLLLFAITFICTQHIMAQKYDEYAKEVRSEVWGWNRPEFKNYSVPDKYKNESAVLIAIHEQIEAKRQKRLRFSAFGSIGVNKEVVYSHILRKMIKINDKVSLDDYSSLSFRSQEKRWGVWMSSKYKTIVGVRIIKADGTINEVDIKAEAVTVDEKEESKKVAIPDLQVGDILDYFICNEGHIDSENIPFITIAFVDKYPILSYSVHCEINKNLTTEYRSVNGAPEFKESTNEDKEIVLDVKKENIAKVEGMNRWSSAFREYPIIRLAILNNGSGNIWKPKTARKSGVFKDVPPETIIADAKCSVGGEIMAGTIDIYKMTRSMAKNYIKENPQVSKEDLACYIFNALQYNWFIDGGGYTYIGFPKYLATLFKEFKIEHKFALTTSRFDVPMNELFNRYDLYFVVLANNNTQFFNSNMPFGIGGEIRPEFEGESVITYANYKFKNDMLQGTEGSFKTPISSPDKNSLLQKIRVSLSEDPMILDIAMESLTKGALKSQDVGNYVTLQKWHEEIRQSLGLKDSFEEYMKSKKSMRKQLDDYNEIITKEQKDQEDQIKKIISEYHQADPKEVLNYEVKHLGVTSQNPNLETSVHYLQEGLVQKAGKNYILNAGKLIGRQLDLKGDDRKRSIDMYFLSSRMFKHEIQITIPDGYTVDNVDNLNISLDNEAASFTSSASINGKTITIEACKTYKTLIEPLQNWDRLLQMLDAGVNFYSQSIVLKKN